MNPEVEQYLEELYRRSVSPPDAMPDRPAGTVYPGGVVIEDEGEVAVRPLSESRFAVREPVVSATPEPAAEAATLPVRDEGRPTSYLEALAAAQERDRMAAGFAGALAGVEQAAQIASRGLYRPIGMPRMPSAVSELEQRQKAVEDYLERQRGLRAETRAERASEAQMELARGQAAREQARAKAEELRLAIEANEAPERVQKLRADTIAALERANLYATQAEAAARGKQPRLVVGGAPSKPDKEGKPKEPKIIPGIPPDYDINQSKPPSTDQINKFGTIVATKYELQGMTDRMRKLASQYSFMERTKPGSAKTAVSQLATQIQIKAKDIAELGALSGPDMGLMKSIASNPASIETAFVDVQAQLDGLDWWSQNAENAKARAWGFKKIEQPPTPGATPQRSPLAAAAEAAVQAVEAARAAGKPKSEIDQLTKKAEAAIEAASKGD